MQSRLLGTVAVIEQGVQIALDCATDVAVVALKSSTGSGTRLLHERRAHNKSVLPAIEALLAKQNLCLADVNELVIGIGPGSFTGVRLAVALAQGVALASHALTRPVSSLAAAARASGRKHHAQSVAVAMDARAGDVYLAAYEFEGDSVSHLIPEQRVAVTELREAMLSSPSNSRAAETHEGWRTGLARCQCWAGDGWALLQDQKQLGGAQEMYLSSRMRNAQMFTTMAPEDLFVLAAPACDPADLQPAYLGGEARWRKQSLARTS